MREEEKEQEDREERGRKLMFVGLGGGGGELSCGWRRERGWGMMDQRGLWRLGLLVSGAVKK